MSFINDFRLSLEKKKAQDKIAFCLEGDDDSLGIILEKLLDKEVPRAVEGLLTNFQGLEISFPRHFSIYKWSDMVLLENRFLCFAVMNENVKICFDTQELNTAKEWDIMNYSNRYLITHTTASFLTNKVWAWINRSRIVWEEEVYPN